MVTQFVRLKSSPGLKGIFLFGFTWALEISARWNCAPLWYFHGTEAELLRLELHNMSTLKRHKPPLTEAFIKYSCPLSREKADALAHCPLGLHHLIIPFIQIESSVYLAFCTSGNIWPLCPPEYESQRQQWFVFARARVQNLALKCEFFELLRVLFSFTSGEL